MVFNLRSDDDHIKLGQLLKTCNLVISGSEAKRVINDGYVKVNGEICTMRGKKIYKGDIVSFEENEVKVI